MIVFACSKGNGLYPAWYVGVLCYSDDNYFGVVAEQTSSFHIITQVFQRLRNHCITVKSSKCEFLCNEVENLGHVVTATGVKTSVHKLEDILKAPRPIIMSSSYDHW